MNRTVVAAVFLLLTVLSFRLAAQDRNVSFVFYGNISIPLGTFGEKQGPNAEVTRRFGFAIGDEAGLAKPGFGAGLELKARVLTDDLFWLLSGKYLVCPTDLSVLQSYFRAKLNDAVDLTFENGTWTNIPIFTGFAYAVRLHEDIALTGSLQAGVNVTCQASRKALVAGKVVEDISFTFTPDFGFEVGLGVDIVQRYSLGVRYLNLGSPRYEGTRILNETFFTTIPKREFTIDGDTRPVTMILFVVGYIL